MASSKAYLQFILDQLSGLEGVSYRAMMGEYILYYRGKIVGGIYDDRLLVKAVPAAITYLPNAERVIPYAGAKALLLVDTVDDADSLTELFRVMYEELPEPKQKTVSAENEGVEIQMEIREFQDKDIDDVFAIQQAAYKSIFEKYHDDATNPYMETKETVFQKYTRNGTKGYLFIKDGIVVGAVRIQIDSERKTGRVSALGVHPDYQRRGIAQEALLRIEALHSAIDQWSLDTILQEEGNCRLYEKLGYKRTGKTERINENMTLVFYEKRVR